MVGSYSNGAMVGFLALTWCASAVSAERIAGSEMVEEAGDFASIFFDLAGERLSKAELEGFLEAAGSVLAWSERHGEEWAKADAADRPLDLVRGFEIWNSIELSASEFVATLAKLIFLQDYAGSPEELKSLKNEIKQMENVIAENRLSPFVLEQAEREISEKRNLVALLQGNVPRNLRLYKAMKERIDRVLDRFEAIGR
ncbi:MAG: hypothetical protein CBD18_08585 [Opitutales bacterium TMED158]|nr:MAG: hypothetical protein CBD18_08585 [Opitutales bacterium TMED158]